MDHNYLWIVQRYIRGMKTPSNRWFYTQDAAMNYIKRIENPKKYLPLIVARHSPMDCLTGPRRVEFEDLRSFANVWARGGG